MFNVIVTLTHSVTQRPVGKFIVYRYQDKFVADKAADDFNRGIGIERPPAIQRVFMAMQYLYPAVVLTATAKVMHDYDNEHHGGIWS
ncbi:MAG: hypothetical protein ACKO0Z_25015 [Betaproteobacteria bacterium]